MAESMKAELLELRASDECGCPEEEWIYGGVTLIIHEETDGNVHAFLDAGDWDTEVFLPYSTLDAARGPIFAWAYDSMHGLFADANVSAHAKAAIDAAKEGA